MKILSHIMQAFKGSRSRRDSSGRDAPYDTVDWREPLLIAAARKHGKPFKCAGDELPREIILGGKELVVVGDDTRTMHGSAQSTAVQHRRAQSVLARLSDSSVLSLQVQGRRELSRSVEEKEF